MSIQLELRVTTANPICRGHDHYWRVIRDLTNDGDTFTRRDVAQSANDRTDKCVADFIKRLVAAGYAEIIEQRQHDAMSNDIGIFNVYRLLKRPARTPIVNRDGTLGVQGLAQFNMWTSMRALNSFDSVELAAVSSTDKVEVQKTTAQRYARHLQDAGYLAILRPGAPNVGRIWRLKPSMNSGPNPPKILRSKMVYDTNLKKIMGTPVATEVAA
ncbi:hypothetical protein [Labrenzia sp. PHM005]|uniref:hypothetical protein n=1 Tax=Labrenzia sp. PHM005 TaxID=2590016 RepID=UPI00113FFB1C|nr:hypothetical protein [Labrenzia sp. PHM005]QDG74430.1 hypothetical protein FJ695_00265 [Labrenzia sp. PHM005]